MHSSYAPVRGLLLGTPASVIDNPALHLLSLFIDKSCSLIIIQNWAWTLLSADVILFEYFVIIEYFKDFFILSGVDLRGNSVSPGYQMLVIRVGTKYTRSLN